LRFYEFSVIIELPAAVNNRINMDNLTDNSTNTPHEPDLDKIREERERLKKFQAEGHVPEKSAQKMFNAVSMYGVAVDFGLAILVPLLLAVYGGRWLVDRTGTKVYLPLAIVAAIIISAAIVTRQIINLKKKIHS
jgi:hypothetical protein